MTPNISRGTVITSLIFKFIERIAVKGLGLIISIILARLLAPEAFGQVAIITVFINLSQMIIQKLRDILVIKKLRCLMNRFLHL